MFGIFKKKEVNNNNIKQFDWAIKAIQIFMSLSEWQKAKKALQEIEDKERLSLNEIVQKLNDKSDIEWLNQKEIEKLKEEFENKIKKLKKLSTILNEKQRLYNKKIDEERFKIRFKKIKEEITTLIWKEEIEKALYLIKNFLEEHWDKTIVIKFYNKEKKKLLKIKEKIDKEKQAKITKNAKAEAMNLIWKTINLDFEEENKKINEEIKTKSFFEKIKVKLSFYKNIKERIRKKKLLDEINILIEEDSKINNDKAAKKLATIQKWLTKEILNEMQWYEVFWKIISTDKISWDTFWFKENKDKYNFFLWDATGHGIRAWFIITLLNKLFNQHYNSNKLWELSYEINNWLKQDLKNRNFITWIFFEIFKNEIWKIKYSWMWHVPIYVYRKKTNTTERIVAWWLAWWIRIIKHPADVKIKELELNNWDILLTYSDWIVENKNSKWEVYWFERLEKAFTDISKSSKDITKIYDYIINDIKIFKWSDEFNDDATAIIIKRDTNKDIVDKWSEYLEKIKWKIWLNNSELKKLQWKSIEDIEKELVVLKKQKETDRIIKVLEWLYYTWEILKVKQEAIKYIKEWYIDKKINDFLKKAIDNEKSYKIKQKNTRAKNKYEVLKQLHKKWDYDTVISVAEEIISSDWEI